MDDQQIDSVPDAPSPRQSRIPAGLTDRASQATRASDVVQTAVEQEEKKPVRCAKFRQQELWAWKPVWSPQVVVIMYAIVALIFIPVGVIVFIQSSRLYASPRLRYDNLDTCDVGSETISGETKVCTVRFTIDKNVSAPSYFYYGMVNFYQNARTYVTSRSDEQLRGQSGANTGTCEPLEKFSNETVIVPCGLQAASRFNDTFRLCRDSGCRRQVPLNGTNISWNVDRTQKFLGSKDFTDEQNELITSEDFMVWMRLAAYRNWKKLYRRIEEPIPAGTYYVRIRSRYPVAGFGGEKFFFISETGWFGGPNNALGLAYIVVGATALIVAIAFAIRSRMTSSLDLPPETTVLLEGFVKHPSQPLYDPTVSSAPVV